MISYIKECLVVCNHNNCSRKFWDNSNGKCDKGKAILDGIEFPVRKIIYKDICIKAFGLWGWGFVCPSVSLSTWRSAIVANAVLSDLKTHKSQILLMIAPRGVTKLSTSPKWPFPHHRYLTISFQISTWKVTVELLCS